MGCSTAEAASISSLRQCWGEKIRAKEIARSIPEYTFSISSVLVESLNATISILKPAF